MTTLSAIARWFANLWTRRRLRQRLRRLGRDDFDLFAWRCLRDKYLDAGGGRRRADRWVREAIELQLWAINDDPTAHETAQHMLVLWNICSGSKGEFERLCDKALGKAA